MPNNITIFRSIRDTDTPFYINVSAALDRIRKGTSKDVVKLVRSEKNKTERNEIKKQLPAICFSGTFKKRADDFLIEHSGIICLDFDGYLKQSDLLGDKEVLSKDKYVYSVFVSPSGNGLKVLVKIPQDPDNHVSYFNALKKHFNSTKFDVTSKNISRVCYESYDPLIFVNENSSIWNELEEHEYVEVSRKSGRPTIPLTDEDKIADILVKWWQKKYPMVEGQRNQNAFTLAMAMNEFGVNRSICMRELKPYAHKSFPELEIERCIESAYRHTESFGTKYYEDEDRVNAIKNKLRRGVSKKEVRYQLQESNLEDDVIDSVLDKIDSENKKQTFWSKTDKGVVRIIHIDFKNFLEDNGFYKYCPEGGKNYVFVRVTNNLIDHTSEKEIKDFTLGYLLNMDDTGVYNYFADNTRFFKEEFLSMLSTIDVYFIADTKDAAYLYYRNCAVKVTGRGVTTMDYMDLGGYVWKDHIIDRNFTVCKVTEKCDYKRFVSNICGRDQSRTDSMESTIGFLLHGYKNLSFCPAVILNDEVISDSPEGGTGKGLFVNAISQMKKAVVIDGKSFTLEKSFAYQLVSADTQILCFDDVKKHFDFERLFSVITEGLTLEKKNKDAIKIPFSKSPKVVITTNYAIKGSGNSFARRKWELELFQHYNQSHTPFDEMGRLMFGDWNDELWCEFDNYMIGCLKRYLNTGLIKAQFVNLKVRQLSAETSHEFIEWCGLVQGQSQEDNPDLIPGYKLYKDDLYNIFVKEYPDYGPKAKMTISRTRFYKWLTSYSIFKTNKLPLEGRDQTGRWIMFKSKTDADQASINFPKNVIDYDEDDE